MGADIHGFWEFKTPDGAWVAFENINDTRSYWWFGIIANVRRPTHDCETLYRGIPDDCSSAWRQVTDAWGRDLHSHTWLFPDEVERANQRLFLEYSKEDGKCPTPDEIADARNYHETIPGLETEVSRIFLPGSEGRFQEMAWTGTLSENIKDQDISRKIRMVVAFDS